MKAKCLVVRSTILVAFNFILLGTIILLSLWYIFA